MASKSVLIVCTSADKYVAPDTPLTGSWMEEVASPYYVFKAKGYSVTIASIKGGEVGAGSFRLAPPCMRHHHPSVSHACVHASPILHVKVPFAAASLVMAPPRRGSPISPGGLQVHPPSTQ